MALVAIAAVSFIPTLWHSSTGMQMLDGNYVTVYDQTPDYDTVFGKSEDAS